MFCSKSQDLALHILDFDVAVDCRMSVEKFRRLSDESLRSVVGELFGETTDSVEMGTIGPLDVTRSVGTGIYLRGSRAVRKRFI